MTSFGALSGGVGAELSGGNFWRGAGTGATISLLNHLADHTEGSLAEKKAFKQKHSLDGMSLATGVTGVSLGNFDDAGNYLHITNKTRKLKFYNRPYVNQNTTNLKIGARGTSFLFFMNTSYDAYQLYNGNMNAETFKINTIKGILGTLIAPLGLGFMTYDLIGVFDSYIHRPPTSFEMGVHRGLMDMGNPDNYTR